LTSGAPGRFNFLADFFERFHGGRVKVLQLFVMCYLIHTGEWLASSQRGLLALSPTVSSLPPLTLMRKNTDVVSGLVSEEHPFHQAQTQPGKAKQHRYERRKVRSILKVGDWGEEIEYEEAS